MTGYSLPIMDAKEILARFRYDPYGFEQFCVDLYRKLGYTGRATRKTSDGGYDFVVSKDGVKTIGECKLYGKSTTVGRPDLQKLYGANATVKAKNLVFITTNTFTPEARQYAREAGIEIIDGKGLKALQMRAKRACAAKSGDGSAPPWKPLTEQDVIDRTPPDLRHTL